MHIYMYDLDLHAVYIYTYIDSHVTVLVAGIYFV